MRSTFNVGGWCLVLSPGGRHRVANFNPTVLSVPLRPSTEEEGRDVERCEKPACENVINRFLLPLLHERASFMVSAACACAASPPRFVVGSRNA